MSQQPFPAGNIPHQFRLLITLLNRSRTLPDLAREKDEMTTPNEAFKKAANSPAGRQAAETTKSIGEDATDFADDLSRKASKQFSRAGRSGGCV